jgi:hypothetical protein
MATKVRPPNKVLWALDEAIEHDTETAELLTQLLHALERENEEAKRRFDKGTQVRLGQAFVTLAKLQMHTGRLASLHRQARNNEYDKR